MVFTSKVGSIRELHPYAAFGQDAHNPMLDEIHLLADGPLTNDVIPRLEDLKSEFGQHGRHKVGISVCKKRHGGHQLAAVEVDNFLEMEVITELNVLTEASMKLEM